VLDDGLGPEWANGSWHLLVVNWKGSQFEVSLDGGGRKSGGLGTAIAPVDVKELIIGHCREATLIDEFMIFRRPLSDRDIRGIMDALHPGGGHAGP